MTPARRRPSLTARARHAIRHSRLFVCLVDAAWVVDAHCQVQAAYAQQCGTPVRVLLAPGVRLPETAFQGITDLQVVRSQGTEADKAQIEAWLEEVACATAHASRAGAATRPYVRR